MTISVMTERRLQDIDVKRGLAMVNDGERCIQTLVSPFVRLPMLLFDFQCAQLVSDDSDQLPIYAH
jgi:hypothetical protein